MREALDDSAKRRLASEDDNLPPAKSWSHRPTRCALAGTISTLGGIAPTGSVRWMVVVRVGGASVRVLQAKQRACRRIRRRAYITLRKKVGKKREARGHHHPDSLGPNAFSSGLAQ